MFMETKAISGYTLTARLPKCVCVCSRVLRVSLGRLSSTINIPMVVYFDYSSAKWSFFLDPGNYTLLSK